MFLDLLTLFYYYLKLIKPKNQLITSVRMQIKQIEACFDKIFSSYIYGMFKHIW